MVPGADATKNSDTNTAIVNGTSPRFVKTNIPIQLSSFQSNNLVTSGATASDGR